MLRRFICKRKFEIFHALVNELLRPRLEPAFALLTIGTQPNAA
jgi:hypothetical protein